MAEGSTGARESLDKEFVGISGLFKLSIWVPTEAVGKVIGKKGAVIQHIQRETRTTCSIISSPSSSSGLGGDGAEVGGAGEQPWSPIVISGDPSRTLAAHDMIRDIVEEIDDAVAEFSVPFHQLPRQPRGGGGGGGLLFGGTMGHHRHHPQSQSAPHAPISEAVQLLSAETSVRIHHAYAPDRRDNSSVGAGSSYRGRDRESHHSHGPMVITLEGEVANIFRAVVAFAAALRAPSSDSGQPRTPAIVQPDTGCRFIGESRSSNSSSSADKDKDKDTWRRKDKDKDNEDSDHAALNYEQYVNVPSSLVGLLLAKRDPDPSVMKQLQRGGSSSSSSRGAQVTIVKLAEPVLVTSGNDNGENDDRDDLSGADERDTGTGTGADTDALPPPPSSKRGPSRRGGGVETFAVRGSLAAPVELAAHRLLRIVAGDKIVTVLADLHTAHQERGSGSGSGLTRAAPSSSNSSGSVARKAPSSTIADDETSPDDDKDEEEDDDDRSWGREAGRGGGRGGGKGRGRGSRGGSSSRGGRGGRGGRGRGGSSSSKQSVSKSCK